MWVRGLKHHNEEHDQKQHVAPYVGAWIETMILLLRIMRIRVAPYVGAWIETVDT